MIAWLQLSVDYSVPHVTLKTTVGLTQNPRVIVAATTGQRGVVAGAEATYDTGKGNITAWNAGAAYNAADFQAAVLLADSGMLHIEFVLRVNRPQVCLYRFVAVHYHWL